MVKSLRIFSVHLPMSNSCKAAATGRNSHLHSLAVTKSDREGKQCLPGAEQAQTAVIDTLGSWGNVTADVLKHLPPFRIAVFPYTGFRGYQLLDSLVPEVAAPVSAAMCLAAAARVFCSMAAPM